MQQVCEVVPLLKHVRSEHGSAADIHAIAVYQDKHNTIVSTYINV